MVNCWRSWEFNSDIFDAIIIGKLGVDRPVMAGETGEDIYWGVNVVKIFTGRWLPQFILQSPKYYGIKFD